MTPRPGTWDQRGARVTAVLPDGRVAYDGRASKEENWFERIGLAQLEPDGHIEQTSDDAVYDARYLDVVQLPGRRLPHLLRSAAARREPRAADRARSLVEQTRGSSRGDRLDPRVRAERGEDRTDVVAHGLASDVQLHRDLIRRRTSREQSEHVALARGELDRLGLCRERWACDEHEHADDLVVPNERNRVDLDADRAPDRVQLDVVLRRRERSRRSCS